MIQDITAQMTYTWDQSIPVSFEGQPLTLAWTGGINSAQVSTIDLDGNDSEDLVVFDRTSEKISTYLVSDTGYEYAPAYESQFPENLKGWMLLRDFNCDGRKDLFAHTPFGIKVYENITIPGGSLDWELVLDPIFTEGSSGLVNLQVNVIDIPGIDDIDGDGDLDILVYNFAVGGGIEYHKNTSMETTGTCGLEFERVTKKWGDFLECECDIFAFGNQECEDVESAARTKHIGGKTIMTIDIDNDGDKEVLIGQEQCEPQYYLENVGTSDDALMTSFSSEFPNATNPIRYYSFPASYYEDIDGDGLKDLVSSTNFFNNPDDSIDFSTSFWFYKNIGTSTLPTFEFIAKDYLQGSMIDLGELVSPAFVDYDRDGDMDMFVGTKGATENGEFIGSVYFFQNTGSASEPSYTLMDQDYLGIKDLALSRIRLQFSDINNDGNSDLLIMGSSDGSTSKIRVLFNQSSSIFSYDLSDFYEIAESFNAEDQFHFTDINGDQLPDLLLAQTTGQLDYYRNVGSADNPNYTLDSENFYGIIADFSKKGLTTTVSDLDNDGSKDLLTMDERGKMQWYSGFLSRLDNPGTAQDLTFEGIAKEDIIGFNFGRRSSITSTTLFPEIGPSIIVGLQTGGLHVLRQLNSQPTPPSNEGELAVIIYPNPSDGNGSGILSVSSNQEADVQLISITGQPVSDVVPIQPGRIVRLDTNSLPSGLYLVKVASRTGNISTRQVVVLN
ncbi:MAG: T9SS type A sorting domain-containing protein [Bacteroidia bacterium]|nr:T9SS type A sorting domain-containing protein [Bacteroidia bacterium]